MSRRRRTLELTRAEAELLDGIVKSFEAIGHEKRTFRSALNDWMLFVSDVEHGYEHTLDDYTNDLSIRNILDGVVEMSPSTIATKLVKAISPWDVRFLAATIESEVPVGVSEIAGKNYWWRRRIPKIVRGELRADLVSMGLNLEDAADEMQE